MYTLTVIANNFQYAKDHEDREEAYSKAVSIMAELFEIGNRSCSVSIISKIEGA